MKSLQKIVQILFGLLFFLVPLILWPFTSELFEFNKMILVYILTILITTTWAVRMITERKFIFRRTILDIPLLIFLGSQVISTILSIDPTTSWFGYYSRLNGGLLSSICYVILYWTFVSNINKEKALQMIKIILWSAVLVSVYGVLEHFGIDKDIWQQDVQHRVFSTLGQPNWLAAWLVALLPITWAMILNQSEKRQIPKLILLYSLSLLLFTTLIFTGSRSGLIGFGVAEVIFWGFILIKYKLKFAKEFLISNALIIIVALIFGTQFTPSISSLVKKTLVTQPEKITQTQTTALDTGGTESGTIRKIVWQGALQVWMHYPIFGTGVETFAYSYYLYRPAAHNMTSEWDYIYNKAHNEYLNFLANTGAVGLLAYLGLITLSIFSMIQNSKYEKCKGINVALIAGYFSILATNFFGFSVVPIQILFYLYPAFAPVLNTETTELNYQKSKLNNPQKIGVFLLLSFTVYLSFITCRYWYADTLYAKGYGYNQSSVNRPDIAARYLDQAIHLVPNQGLYYSELSKSYTNLALAYFEAKDATASSELAQAAVANTLKAVNLSPANVNFKRIEFGVFFMLSKVNPSYLIDAKDVLVQAAAQAPTDAKIHYNLGLIYSRLGQNDLALQTLKETIDMKPNYNEAREQFEYILKNVDPNDPQTKQNLESIK